MLTIGVAIAIPEPHGGELQRYRASFGDPSADAIPTHVTLLPPTLVDDDLSDVDKHLSEVAASHRPFCIHLRGTATFRPVSPVVFVAMTEGISACEMLATSVRSGPLDRELMFPYHPHVTVAHDVPDKALDTAFETLADYDVSFDVTEFWLYLHGDDDVWRPHQAFALGSGDRSR